MYLCAKASAQVGLSCSYWLFPTPLIWCDMFKYPYIEGNFCLFYAIACHFLVRGEGEGERGGFEKKMTNLTWKEVGERFKKCSFERNLLFEWLLYENFEKICIFDPQTIIYNKLLFFLQMENWLLVNRSFNDGSGKPVCVIAVRSSVLRTFTEGCNSSVSSSAIQFFTVNLPMTCQY